MRSDGVTQGPCCCHFQVCIWLELYDTRGHSDENGGGSVCLVSDSIQSHCHRAHWAQLVCSWPLIWVWRWKPCWHYALSSFLPQESWPIGTIFYLECSTSSVIVLSKKWGQWQFPFSISQCDMRFLIGKCYVRILGN